MHIGHVYAVKMSGDEVMAGLIDGTFSSWVVK